MTKYKNDLAGIKRWLDLLYYIELAGSEEKLDSIILFSGIAETDLTTNFNSTYNLEEVFSTGKFSIINFTSEESYVERIGNKEVHKTKTKYHYTTGVRYSSMLDRAIINNLNPELAKYGYSYYSLRTKDDLFFVNYDDIFCLYIPIKAYIKGDIAAVNNSIMSGLKNKIDCTRGMEYTPKQIKALYNKVVTSDLYKNILKLKPC